MKVANLRGPSVAIRGLVDFARMLGKIRLQAAGELPDKRPAAASA